tara:strand:- start:5592 stop:5768 length:177 start_codon:yes stop_codon:yes gene_type:complete
MDEFKNYYRIIEEKLANKDFSNDMEVVEKEKKKPKKRLNQIFFGVPTSKSKSSKKNVN